MSFPAHCPSCLSRWPSTRGMVYSVGSHVGTLCDNTWHAGIGYDPAKLDLNDYDKAMLKGMKIGV